MRRFDNRYEAFERNDFVLPSKKSTLVNTEYLNNVRAGLYWVPVTWKEKSTDPGDVVIIRNCPRPPPKLELAQMLLKEAHKKGVELGFNLEKGYIADTAWMLKALATLNPKHKIFAKDFVPRVDKVRPTAVVMIDNSDDFYSNLPDLYLKKDIRGRATACISKSEKLA